MAKAKNINGENNGILVEKLEIYIAILEGRKEKSSSHLQKFYNEIKNKGKEDLLSELINLYLNFCHSEDDYTHTQVKNF